MSRPSSPGKILPDEVIKAMYRRTKRALGRGPSRATKQQLQAELEFLERIYLF